MVTKMCIAAANYIIERTNEYNQGVHFLKQISMTGKRLQKLLYFSDVVYMKHHNGESMFTDTYFAWPSGPVIPSVYYEFIQYQNGSMKPVDGEHTPLTNDMKNAIDYVFENTISLDTLDLVEKSHISEGPWSKVFNANDPEHEQVVSKSDIYEFYKNRDFFN